MKLESCNLRLKVKLRIKDGKGNVIEEVESEIGDSNEVVFGARDKILGNRK